MSPELESALVVVVNWKEVPAPEVAATPSVPMEVIAIGMSNYGLQGALHANLHEP